MLSVLFLSDTAIYQSMWLGVLSVCLTLAGQAEVAVHVESGRTFHGLVDPRSNDQQLVIRSTYGRAVFLRPIQWDRVQTAASGGVAYPADRFKGMVEELKQQTPQRFWPQELLVPGGPPYPPAASPIYPPLCFPVVRSLQAAIRLSNWNADAAADGYTLLVAPLGADGSLIPVEGAVDAMLCGYETLPGDPVERWTELNRWSERLTLACYGPQGGVLRLPFCESPKPLANARLPRRVLRLQLRAEGQGTFDAEVPLLAERPPVH